MEDAGVQLQFMLLLLRRGYEQQCAHGSNPA